jgi:hypothetical protein
MYQKILNNKQHYNKGQIYQDIPKYTQNIPA